MKIRRNGSNRPLGLPYVAGFLWEPGHSSRIEFGLALLALAKKVSSSPLKLLIKAMEKVQRLGSEYLILGSVATPWSPGLMAKSRSCALTSQFGGLVLMPLSIARYGNYEV